VTACLTQQEIGGRISWPGRRRNWRSASRRGRPTPTSSGTDTSGWACRKASIMAIGRAGRRAPSAAPQPVLLLGEKRSGNSGRKPLGGAPTLCPGSATPCYVDLFCVDDMAAPLAHPRANAATPVATTPLDFPGRLPL